MRDKILELARGELGVKEAPPGSNRVKYNTAYYGRKVSGRKFPWCCVFIWWLFQQAGAPELYFGGNRTAYCPALLHFHQTAGQNVEGDYRPGDLIFYNFSGGRVPEHVGLCERFDGGSIVTIEGNTGTGQDANGGAVMRRVRPLGYLVGAVRPNYKEAEKKMEREEVKALIRELEEERFSAQPSPTWGLEAREWAVEQKIFVGDEAGKLNWEAPVTRNQLATILYKLMNRK